MRSNDDAWPAIDLRLANEVTTALMHRGPERHRLMEQVGVVASIVEQRGGALAAATYLRRSPAWVSKHLHLHETRLWHRQWTFMAMADDVCRDVEIVYTLSLIEEHDAIEASLFYARLRREAHARSAGHRAPLFEYLTRETIRSKWREVKRKARAADEDMRPAAGLYRGPSQLSSASTTTPA